MHTKRGRPRRVNATRGVRSALWGSLCLGRSCPPFSVIHTQWIICRVDLVLNFLHQTPPISSIHVSAACAVTRLSHFPPSALGRPLAHCESDRRTYRLDQIPRMPTSQPSIHKSNQISRHRVMHSQPEGSSMRIFCMLLDAASYHDRHIGMPGQVRIEGPGNTSRCLLDGDRWVNVFRRCPEFR
jgi:hypothetical protein